MAQFLLVVLAQVLAGLLVMLIGRRWRLMRQPPKERITAAVKMRHTHTMSEGCPKEREVCSISLSVF